MGTALRALNFDAAHAVARVLNHFEIFVVNRGVEARPAGARFKFCAGTEQFRITTNTVIRAVVVEVPIFAGKGRFCAALAGDLILLRGELFFPFVVSLLHAFSLHWKLANTDPIRLFKKWFDAAVRAELKEPNAM